MNQTLTIPLQIKALSKREFEGYGSIFGNKDYGDDIVMPGAFAKTLAEHKADESLPMMFWMHDPARIPGKWTEMSEDANGLYVKGILADTELGNEIHTLLGMKAVKGLSIGYITRDQEFDEEGTRLIKEAELLETSIVSLPMNPKAQIVHAKSRLSESGEYVPTKNELAELKRATEHFFISKGFHKSLAKTYASNLFKEKNGAMPDLKDDAMSDNDKLLAAAYEEHELQVNDDAMSDINKGLDSLLSRLTNDKLVQEMNLYTHLKR